MSIEGSTVACPELLDRLLEAFEQEVPHAIALRQTLHQTAELSHSEHTTSESLQSALSELSLTPLEGAGFYVAVGATEGPAITVRAELDALPIAEATGSPFASANGHMHACGHDVHMAALTGVLRAAATLSDELPVPLLGLFQPSEEAYPSGAKMIVDGDRLPPVAAVIAMHVHPQVDWLSVAANAGPINASCDNIKLTVTGSPGHAAYPQEANDPIVALSHAIVSLQQIVSRRTNPTDGVAITVSWLRSGGADNAIPEVAEAGGTLRVLDHEDREAYRQMIRATVEHVAAACNCRADVTFEEGEPRVINDDLLTASIRPALEEAGFELAPALRSCGSDDFGYFLGVAPTLLGFVGVRGAPGAEDVPLHHPRFLPPAEAVRKVGRAQIAAYLGAAYANSNRKRTA